MTSGLSVERPLHRGGAVARFADHLHVGLAVDQQLAAHGARSRDRRRAGSRSGVVCSAMVASLLDSAGRAMRRKMVVPLPGVDSISSVAPTSDARSCMPEQAEAVGVRLASGVASNPTPLSSTMSDDRVAAALEDDVDASRAASAWRRWSTLPARSGRASFRCPERAVRRRSPDTWRSAGNADAPRPVLHVVGERRAQTEVVECRRAQLPHQLIDVAIELPRDLSRARSRAPASSGEPLHASFIASIAAAERRQLFAELVVHLARDPSPLVFLREDQPRQQLRARAFGVRLPCAR